jgi:hypothetical protein
LQKLGPFAPYLCSDITRNSGRSKEKVLVRCHTKQFSRFLPTSFLRGGLPPNPFLWSFCRPLFSVQTFNTKKGETETETETRFYSLYLTTRDEQGVSRSALANR